MVILGRELTVYRKPHGGAKWLRVSYFDEPVSKAELNGKMRWFSANAGDQVVDLKGKIRWGV